MRFSRSSALPEKTISMHRISVGIRIPQRDCREDRMIANNRTGKHRRRNELPLVMPSLPGLQQGPSSKRSYRQAFAKV
jgi:hypothetical protein